MVRINLLNPISLSDQHLIAEYNEMLMLEGQLRKHPRMCKGPREYCLGEGHIKFFRDKLEYLHRRHELLKKEMRRRGFNPSKSFNLKGFPESLHKNYSPDEKAISIIKKRIIEKIAKKKGFYRYYGKRKSRRFLIRLVKTSK